MHAVCSLVCLRPAAIIQVMQFETPCLGNGAAQSWQGSPEDELLPVPPLQPSAGNLSLKLFPGDASGVDIANHRRLCW